MSIEFDKPKNLDGIVLEALLLEANIAIPERSITVIDNKVYLEIDEKHKEIALQILKTMDL